MHNHLDEENDFFAAGEPHHLLCVSHVKGKYGGLPVVAQRTGERDAANRGVHTNMQHTSPTEANQWHVVMLVELVPDGRQLLTPVEVAMPCVCPSSYMYYLP